METFHKGKGCRKKYSNIISRFSLEMLNGIVRVLRCFERRHFLGTIFNISTKETNTNMFENNNFGSFFI